MIKSFRPCETRTYNCNAQHITTSVTLDPINQRDAGLNKIMPLPKSNKDLTGVREFIANLHTQFASAATVIGPACATLFDEVAGKLKGVLEGLPKDETAATHAGWALPENWAFEALGAANNLVSGLRWKWAGRSNWPRRRSSTSARTCWAML